jgi:tRNA(fMet)-specific endonuclease VapC
MVCSIVRAELFFGAAMSHDPVKTLTVQRLFLSQFQSLPFDGRAAEEYAEIRADLKRQGQPIGPNDLLIAAICRANHATLVTHNVNEFRRIAGLKLDDWEA